MENHLRIFVALVLGSVIAADSCPPSENIVPCTCGTSFGDSYVRCTNLQNVEELKKALTGVKGLKLYSLDIEASNLGDVPGDIFKDTSIEDLTFSYTKITSIGDDGKLPFSGLENSLRRLTVKEGFWNYDQPLTKPIPIDHLKKLTYLDSENNIIPKLGNEWFAKGPTSLKDLFIQNSLMKEVGDKAFAPLENLRTLHFSGNQVTLPRSALPERAIYLDTLDLSDNEIVDVSSDMFSNLPALKYLYLDDNGIQHLPESTFKPVMKQLEYIFLVSNPLECGPKMKWLFRENLQEKIIGSCATPPALSGKELDTLTVSDISD